MPKSKIVKKRRTIVLPDKLALDEYDPAQLRMGIEVEKEHTSDPKLARQIAEDHLREIPDYYTRLIAMENEYKKEIGERDKKKNWAYIILRRRQDEKKPILRHYEALSYAEGIVEIQQSKNQAAGYGWECESVQPTTKDGGIKYFCRKMTREKLRVDYTFELLAMSDFEKIKPDIIFEGKHGQTTGEEVAMIDKKIAKLPKESDVHELISILISKGYADASIIVELEKQFHLKRTDRNRSWLKKQISYLRKMMKPASILSPRAVKKLNKELRPVERKRYQEWKKRGYPYSIGSEVDYQGRKAIITNIFKDGVEIDTGDGNLEIVPLTELYGELTKTGKHFGVDGDVGYRNMPYTEPMEGHAQGLVNAGKKPKEILAIMMKELEAGDYREEEHTWGREDTIEAIKSAIEDAFRIFKRKEVNLDKKIEEIPEAIQDLIDAEIDRGMNV